MKALSLNSVARKLNALNAPQEVETEPLAASGLSYLRVIRLIQRYYVILPLIPTILGSCFLVGYISPAGPTAIQSISYVDIFTFAFIFAILSVAVIFSSFMINSIYAGLSELAGHKISLIVSVVVILAASLLMLYFGLNTQIRPTKIGSFYLNMILVLFILPSFFVFIYQKRLFLRILPTSLVVTLSAYIAGSLMGSFDYRYKAIEDQVCTDRCWKVGVFAVLSEFVIAIDCSRSIFLFPRSEVKRITMAPAPLDATGALAKAITDDVTSCPNISTPKSNN